MANTYLEVRAWGSTGAWTDLTPYIAYNGLKQSRNDIEAAGSGRDTQDGVMHRARVASKKKLEITCRPLLDGELAIVLQAIYPQWLEVRYKDDRLNAVRTTKMYSNNASSTFLILKRGEWHNGVSFPLIEE